MTVEIYLYSYVKMVHDISAREEEIRVLRERAEKETAGYAPVTSGSSEKRPMASLMDTVVTLENELQEKKERKKAAEIVITKEIMKLEDPDCRRAMFERFINGRSVKEISEQMCVCRMSVYRYLDTGFTNMQLPEDIPVIV